MDHLQVHNDSKTRYLHPDYKFKTNISCQKCTIPLCINNTSNNFSAVNVLIQCKWWCKVRWYFGSVHCVFGQNEYRIFTWVLPCPLGTRDRSYTVRQCWLDNKIYCASYMQHTVLLPCYNTVHTPKIRKLYNRAYIPYFTIFQPCMHCIVFNLVLYIYIYNLQLKLIKN
jgi:hypothetical protein